MVSPALPVPRTIRCSSRGEGMSKPLKSVSGTCVVCGLEFVVLRARSGGRTPKLCKDPKCKSEFSARTMASTNRKWASARMKSRNPMHDPEARGRMRTTLQAMGHKPPVQGGNGRGPTACELQICEALGPGWTIGDVVRTGRPRQPGAPTHYKLDVSSLDLMVTVEVDGASHCALERQEQDARKSEFLSGLGWMVFRVRNLDLRREPESTISRLKDLIRTSRTES